MTSLSLYHRTIENAMECIDGMISPVCKQIQDDVKDAKFAYADETKMSVSGLTSWIWAVITATEVLYLVHRSRAGAVIDMMVNDAMTLVCDGYSGYKYDKQRCWSHILRASDDESKNDPQLDGLNHQLHELFIHARDTMHTDAHTIRSLECQAGAIADMYDQYGSPFAGTLRAAARTCLHL